MDSNKNSEYCKQNSRDRVKTGSLNIWINRQTKGSSVQKIAWRSVLLLTLSLGHITSANATAITTGQFFWNTFTVTANGNAFTPTWTLQDDFIEASYWEGNVLNNNIVDNSIFPNPNWTTSQTTVDGGIATTQTASVAPDLLSATVEADYSSESKAFLARFGSFVAPEDGVYTFSVDTLVSAEINALNTQLGGSSAFPFMELQYFNTDAPGGAGSFTFEFIDSVDLTNTFDSTGDVLNKLSISTRFDGTPINFLAGDLIEISATIDIMSRSFSSESIPTTPPTPIPNLATIWLFIIGCLSLIFHHINRKRKLS